MLSLHQLTCFMAAYETGSLTAAADRLGYAQPSVSEQIRALEKTLGVQLFRRVGRGVVPTTVGDTFHPHAAQVLAAARDAEEAAHSVRRLETGTIRFGLFGTARLYGGAALVADVLARHPGVRVELIGQNSNAVWEQLRRGQMEAAMIATAGFAGEGMEITPVAKDELVYISADPDATASPVTAARLAKAQLVMSETTWRTDDSTRIILRRMLQEVGHNPATRIEVEDVETAIELVGRGLADSVVQRGVAHQLIPRLAPGVTMAPLRPRQEETIAIVHRAGVPLSPAATLMIELATRRILQFVEPV